MEAVYELRNHAIAVPEPERAILDLKAGGVAMRRIRDLPLPTREPDAVRAAFQAGAKLVRSRVIRDGP